MKQRLLFLGPPALVKEPKRRFYVIVMACVTFQQATSFERKSLLELNLANKPKP